MNITTSAPKYQGAAAAAKAIKAELKKAFPTVKFSVKSKNYSGGNSISIHWFNGPTVGQVERISGKYELGSFDGMTDSYNYESTLIVDSADGQLKELGGAKYVFASRAFFGDYAAESAFFENVQRDLCALQRMPFTGPRSPIYPNDTRPVDEVADRVVAAIDFTKGNYAGVKFSESGLTGFEAILVPAVSR
jgi:hypothetical protein